MIALENGNAWNANFRFEPKRQNVWDVSHATWFFAMGLGGALFLNRLLFNIRLGSWAGFEGADVLGLVLIGLGGLILIADLGKPMRFLRAIANLRSSWISWGFLADCVFVVAGLIVLLAGGPAPVAWIAGLAALFVIVYPGFVMAGSPSIPFWNTPLVPLQFLAYAFASAAGLALALGPSNPTAAVVGAASFAFALAFSGLHLLGARLQRGVARLAADEVASGTTFLVAIALGVLVPLVAALLELGGVRLGPLWLAAAALALAANWIAKLAVLRAGYYAPLF